MKLLTLKYVATSLECSGTDVELTFHQQPLFSSQDRSPD